MTTSTQRSGTRGSTCSTTTLGRTDDAERALAIGQSLLLLHDGIDQVKGHDDRDEPLFALSIGSAVHWPHRA